MATSPIDSDEMNMNVHVGDSTSKAISEAEFVKIIGHAEDILVDEDFQTRHNNYFSEHWKQFSVDEDNPLDSTELEKLSKERFNIFRTYSVEMAAFIESALRRSLGNHFEIQGLLQEIESRTQTLESSKAQENNSSGRDSHPNSPRGGPSHPESDMDGEIFDMLLTLKDYGRFQELMVDYSKMMQGQTPDMDDLVSSRKISDDETEII